MKSISAVLVASAALVSAQVTVKSGQVVCDRPNASFCVGDSLKTDMIAFCDAQGNGWQQSCAENTHKTGSLCWSSSETSGDAACESDCVVYGNTTWTLSEIECSTDDSKSSTRELYTSEAKTIVTTIAAPSTTDTCTDSTLVTVVTPPADTTCETTPIVTVPAPTTECETTPVVTTECETTPTVTVEAPSSSSQSRTVTIMVGITTEPVPSKHQQSTVTTFVPGTTPTPQMPQNTTSVVTPSTTAPSVVQTAAAVTKSALGMAAGLGLLAAYLIKDCCY